MNVVENLNTIFFYLFNLFLSNILEIHVQVEHYLWLKLNLALKNLPFKVLNLYEKISEPFRFTNNYSPPSRMRRPWPRAYVQVNSHLLL